MTKYEAQSGFKAPGALHLVNTSSPMLSNNPTLKFSDAPQRSAPSTPISPTDPRYLIAVMTQTRQQCRTAGLIKRDHAELIHIAQTLGLSTKHTQQIIELVQSTPNTNRLTDEQLTELASIPLGSIQKKTRISLRVLVVLSIWAITIAVAMQMV